ncbi:Vps5 C terminal like-domain-containing protein [Dipodascopsis tothii]|uniref:Vps5 C terminal like-domain-containing protein n=1 Tax=Dipodascopsis tothii TaxID=44089 RepID=UPI0034CE8D37
MDDPDNLLGGSQWDDLATPTQETESDSPERSDPLGYQTLSTSPQVTKTTDGVLENKDLQEASQHPVKTVTSEISKVDDESAEDLVSSYATLSSEAARARALRKARSKKLSNDPTAVARAATGIDPLVSELATQEAESAKSQEPTWGSQTHENVPDFSSISLNTNPKIGGINSILTGEIGEDLLNSRLGSLSLEQASSSSVLPQPVAPSSSSRHISLEQAANPTFDISIGDPTKVGDLAAAHTVYTVRTQTTSKAYRYSDFTVTRRYRDFRWIYHALNNNNPGIIVPAPPKKQTVGRFDESFVEGRRSALEKMLNRIAHHPVLQHDPDLKIFLESETFSSDMKTRDKTSASSSLFSTSSLPGVGTGLVGTNGVSVGSTESRSIINSIGGAFSTTFNTGKFIETDDWFVDKRAYVDALDVQLRALAKALDTVIVQRKELADTTADFALALQLLSEIELSRHLSGALSGLSEVQQRVRDLCERQGLQDMLTLGDTIDEYSRMIDSIRVVFIQREKFYISWQTASQELTKRQNYLGRVMRQGKTPADRLNILQEEVADHERRVYTARVQFDDICKTIKIEFEKFQKEKIDEFRASVETYLESAVESQKEAIETWETFYERQGFADRQVTTLS